ncbi:MAG: undecaprenyl-phosphate glucose phosphotransferase [Pseudomonadota bacterium]
MGLRVDDVQSVAAEATGFTAAKQPESHAAPQQRTSWSLDVVSFVIGALDCFVISLAVAGSAYTGGIWRSYGLFMTEGFAAAVALWCISVMIMAGAYRFNVLRSPLRHLRKILMPLAGAFCAALYFSQFVAEPMFIKGNWTLTALVLCLIGVTAARVLSIYVLLFATQRGVIARRIAILGAGPQGERLLSHLQQDQLSVNHVFGVFDDRQVAESRTSDNMRLAGTSKDLLKAVRERKVDDVIVALPWTAELRLRELIAELSAHPVNIRLGADLAAFQFPGKMNTDVLTGLPMVTISNNPLAGWRRIAKALEDRILGGLLVLLFSPIMLLVALAVKLDSPGPILFRQKRLGFNNAEFNVYKFRSMRHETGQVAKKTVQAARDDERVTRVGRFIRRTSLDELPQLLNVLEGSMSLVGPRPHALDHNEEYGHVIDNYFARHRVKPGITGLAQVNGLRGETDTLEKMEYRVRYDLHYVENWSILMDLEILALTGFIGFFGRNAY